MLTTWVFFRCGISKLINQYFWSKKLDSRVERVVSNGQNPNNILDILNINFVTTTRSCQQSQTRMMPCSLIRSKSIRKKILICQYERHHNTVHRRVRSNCIQSVDLPMLDGVIWRRQWKTCLWKRTLGKRYKKLNNGIFNRLLQCCWPFQVRWCHFLNLVIENKHSFTVAAVTSSTCLFSIGQIDWPQNNK